LALGLGGNIMVVVAFKSGLSHKTWFNKRCDLSENPEEVFGVISCVSDSAAIARD
jgi:hypothetical protein